MPLSKRPAAKRKQLANRRDAPPAPKSNRRAQKHGARAKPPSVRVESIEADLLAALPVKDDGQPPLADRHIVGLLAVTYARLMSVEAYIERHGGPLTPRGKVREAAVYEQKLTERARVLSTELGLTPKSRAALGVDVAHLRDLAIEMSALSDADTIDGTATDDDELDDEEDA